MTLVNLHLLLRLALGALMLSSGSAKLRHPNQFRQGVEAYHIVPGWLAGNVPVIPLLAWGIPFLEVLAGLSLVCGVEVVPALGVVLALLGIFSVALAINLLRGHTNLTCHCSGVLGDYQIAWWQLARNGVLLLCAIAALITPADPFLLIPVGHAVSGATAAAWLNTFLPTALLVGLLLAGVVIVTTIGASFGANWRS